MLCFDQMHPAKKKNYSTVGKAKLPYLPPPPGKRRTLPSLIETTAEETPSDTSAISDSGASRSTEISFPNLSINAEYKAFAFLVFGDETPRTRAMTSPNGIIFRYGGRGVSEIEDIAKALSRTPSLILPLQSGHFHLLASASSYENCL